MKRQAVALGDLAERGNLLLATWKAASGKHQRPAVARFLAQLDSQLDALAARILGGGGPLGLAHAFTIHDPKRRSIQAACFADRVLHHAIFNLAAPRFERMLVPSSYACRPGKGVHAAVAQAQRNLQRFGWWVQVDVDGYFPSIDHARLKALLATRFKGDGFLALLGQVIDLGGSDSRGLPIGAPSSQHFANAYLDSADRMLLAHPDVCAHVRYMDDTLWWCRSREQAQATLRDYAAGLWNGRALRLKPTARIGPSRQGLRYCGFRIHQGAVLPSARKLTRYRRHAAQLEDAWAAGALDEAALQRAASAAQATLAHCQARGFLRRYWQSHRSAYGG